MLEINKVHLGDSYKLIKEIDDNSVDCIYTDIPYKYCNGGQGHSEMGVRTAKKKEELKDISSGIDYAILDDFVRVMKKINCFIWCSKLQILDIMNYFEKLGCNSEILMWGKTNPTPQTNNTWLPDIEYCLYFREKCVKLNDGYEIKSKYYISNANKSDKNKFDHPTIKPLELVERHLKHATQPNDLVLDPFIGSGTTGIACENTNRNYIGIEIEPKWYNVSTDRLNGIQANGQASFILN